jgi:uncharacterized protein (DUF433 family)
MQYRTTFSGALDRRTRLTAFDVVTREALETKYLVLGMTRQEIADHYGVSLASIKRMLISFQVAKQTAAMCKAKRDEIIVKTKKLLQAGFKAHEVAPRFGMDANQLTKVYRDSRVAMPNWYKHSVTNTVPIELVVRHRVDGETLQQIGDRFGLTRARIGQILDSEQATEVRKRFQRFGADALGWTPEIVAPRLTKALRLVGMDIKMGRKVPLDA